MKGYDGSRSGIQFENLCSGLEARIKQMVVKSLPNQFVELLARHSTGELMVGRRTGFENCALVQLKSFNVQKVILRTAILQRSSSRPWAVFNTILVSRTAYTATVPAESFTITLRL